MCSYHHRDRIRWLLINWRRWFRVLAFCGSSNPQKRHRLLQEFQRPINGSAWRDDRPWYSLQPWRWGMWASHSLPHLVCISLNLVWSLHGGTGSWKRQTRRNKPVWWKNSCIVTVLNLAFINYMRRWEQGESKYKMVFSTCSRATFSKTLADSRTYDLGGILVLAGNCSWSTSGALVVSRSPSVNSLHSYLAFIESSIPCESEKSLVAFYLLEDLRASRMILLVLIDLILILW